MAWKPSWRWSSLAIGLLAHILPRLVGPAEGGLLGPAQGLTPRPVCASQYALANYACSMIPYSPLSPRSGSAPPQDDDEDRGLRHSHSHSHSHSHRHHHTRSSSGRGHGQRSGGGHHRRRHHRHHRSRDGGDGDGDGEDSDEEEGDDEENQGTPEEEDCCRWLSEMDNDCVCEMLVRLPDFLSRPLHQYTVSVGDSCNVTYACGGRVIRK